MKKNILFKKSIINFVIISVGIIISCGDSDKANPLKAVNTAPLVNDISISTSEHSPVNITFSAIDPDNNELSWHIDSFPNHGSLSGTYPEVTYLPDLGYIGNDSFTYYVDDNITKSNIATVSITITENSSGNTLPTADDKIFSTIEDVSITFFLTASDPDNDDLIWHIDTLPQNGQLDGIPPELIFTPDSNYNDHFGESSFTYYVSDSKGSSNLATVRFKVKAVNDPASSHNQWVSTPEDIAVNIALTSSDPDDDLLMWYIDGYPSHGILTGVAPNLIYTPDPEYNGSDNFTFHVDDGMGESNIAVVSITVGNINDTPIVNDLSVSTNEDESIAITLTASDPDGDDLTWNINNLPQHGSIQGTAPDLIYTPGSGFYGLDSFTFHVNDGNFDSNIATVVLTIIAGDGENGSPIANDLPVSTNEDESITITLTASDPDGDDLTWNINNLPQHGSIQGTAPDLIYTPNPNFYGSDIFTFAVNDGNSDSNIATVTISINSVQDIWYVDKDILSGGDGQSWTSAFVHPMDAVDAADSGDSIWVADGNYYRRNTSDIVLLEMKAGVEIYGGFNGTESDIEERGLKENLTILDGQDVVFHVVKGASNSVLDGFTITSGAANGDEEPDYLGGGMYNSNCPEILTVSNCIFIENHAEFGAGMYNNTDSEIMITNCTFSNNESGYEGGGLLNYFCSSVIYNCIFEGNNSMGEGGGVFFEEGTSTLVNCTFVENEAWEEGGAIYNEEGSLTIYNSILSGNLPDEIIGDATITYSNVDGEVYPGVGNISEDPYFVTGSWGNYYLDQAISPCLDGGDPDTPVDVWDILSGRTTSIDESSDTEVVDMGYHYSI